MQTSQTSEKKPEPLTLISASIVANMLGVSKGSIPNFVRDGVIPPALLITPTVHRWYKHEIQAVLDKAIAARGQK